MLTPSMDHPFDDCDPKQLLAGTSDWLEDRHWSALSAHPLECIDKEFPHHHRAVEGPDDIHQPSDRHPAFYGCFDWHSAVHSHWALLRQLRCHQDHPKRSAIIDAMDAHLTPDAIEHEVAAFEDNPTFERPYGWGWLLRLVTELELLSDEFASAWRSAIRPLEHQMVELTKSRFLSLDRPFRVGTHPNSAFSLAAVIDYARGIGDTDLEAEATAAARRWFGDDTDYPIRFEPLGWDFISPALAEADLMRRVLDDDFRPWFDEFLPNAPTLDLEPVTVSGDDGLALHLVAVNLHRAWVLADLAERLEGHPAADRFETMAIDHAEAGIADAFTDEYAGAHWLTSFVLYLLTRREGAIANP